MKAIILNQLSTSIRSDDSFLFVILIISFLALLVGVHYFILHYAQIKQAFFNYLNTYYSMLSRDEE